MAQNTLLVVLHGSLAVYDKLNSPNLVVYLTDMDTCLLYTLTLPTTPYV